MEISKWGDFEPYFHDLSLDTDNLLTSGRNAFPALSESEYDFPEYCELGQDIRAKSTHLCWTRISLVSANRNQRSLVRTSRSAGATVWKKYSSSGLRMLSNWSLSNSDPENPGTRIVDSATQTLDSGQVAWPSPFKKFDGDGWLENSLRSSVSAGCALWQKVIPQLWIRICVMRVCWVWSEHTGMRPGRLEARGNYWTTVKAHALHFLHTKKVRQTHCLDDLRCWWSTWWVRRCRRMNFGFVWCAFVECDLSIQACVQGVWKQGGTIEPRSQHKYLRRLFLGHRRPLMNTTMTGFFVW